jgi:hypothetical protein
MDEIDEEEIAPTMDEQQIASTLDGFSQRLFSSVKNHTRIEAALKSIGGIALLYAVHESGKPFSPYAHITPIGTIVAQGNADTFNRLISQVVYREALAVPDNNHSVRQALVSVGHVLKSCYTVAKELAATIPDGQTMHWVCRPIGILPEGYQMIVMADSEIPRIKEWAQQNNLLGDLKQEDLVSLDKFKDFDGKTLYPKGWMSIEAKEARLMLQRNGKKQQYIKALDSEGLEEITI